MLASRGCASGAKIQSLLTENLTVNFSHQTNELEKKQKSKALTHSGRSLYKAQNNGCYPESLNVTGITHKNGFRLVAPERM